MTSEQHIYDAADDLDATIAHRLDELADRILERPEVGSQEWFDSTERLQADPEAANAHEREWQLVKLRISRHAGIDPTTIVHCARALGVSWDSIADCCGITAHAAYSRWSNAATATDSPPRGSTITP